MDAPYIPGFLAFREADHLATLGKNEKHILVVKMNFLPLLLTEEKTDLHLDMLISVSEPDPFQVQGWV